MKKINLEELSLEELKILNKKYLGILKIIGFIFLLICAYSSYGFMITISLLLTLLIAFIVFKIFINKNEDITIKGLLKKLSDKKNLIFMYIFIILFGGLIIGIHSLLKGFFDNLVSTNEEIANFVEQYTQLLPKIINPTLIIVGIIFFILIIFFWFKQLDVKKYMRKQKNKKSRFNNN